jgi:hypothetical protein
VSPLGAFGRFFALLVVTVDDIGGVYFLLLSFRRDHSCLDLPVSAVAATPCLVD